MTKSIREIIISTFTEIFSDQVDGLSLPELSDKLILLESGLDSMGFAILVSELEERLGFDPFSISDEAFYPSNLGEFISFYEKHKP
jgi:acyl carrier protein